MNALRCVKTVELVDIPLLTKCVFLSAFKCVQDVKMENAGEFENVKELMEAIERKKREEAEEAALMAKKNPIVWNQKDWEGIVPSLVEVLVVKDNCCSDDEIRVLDLSGYVNLREFNVGDYCFRKVEELKLNEMKCLESVVIGQVSFVKNPYNTADGRDDKRHFYLKNCPKLKSLKIGLKAFLDYSVCEIENVNALEVIEMGDLNDGSWSFYWSSLELISQNQPHIISHRTTFIENPCIW